MRKAVEWQWLQWQINKNNFLFKSYRLIKQAKFGHFIPASDYILLSHYTLIRLLVSLDIIKLFDQGSNLQIVD